MIKLQNMTPDIYYRQSRDFQFIGRLYDVVLNAVKTNTDLIYALQLSANSDERLIDLMALTLGFNLKHNYNVKQLTNICSAFSEIIKNKGSVYAVELAASALLNAEGITDKYMVFFDKDDPYKINIFIPEILSDLNLFKDLLNYILPAGMSYNIVRVTEFELANATTVIETEDKLTFKALVNNQETSALADVITDSHISGAHVVIDENAEHDKDKVVVGVFGNTALYDPRLIPQPEPLTSYDDIVVGKKYHVILPAGVAFHRSDNEFIYGTITDVTPESVIASRGTAGTNEVGYGSSSGAISFNALIEGLPTGKGIKQNEACEFNIIVSSFRGSGNYDKLYQYMYEVK